MEILIYQAGEQLGPFSETQVREYLDAGLFSPSDLAIYRGMESWQSLDHVLTHLPAPSDELGLIFPDEPPSDPPATAVPEPHTEQPFIMQNTSSETVESSSVP